jgi:RHS repeat-associated protein
VKTTPIAKIFVVGRIANPTYFGCGLSRYEMKSGIVPKYYSSPSLSAGFAGMKRVAMRKYTTPQSMSMEYLLGDHLGLTSITTDADGAKVSEMRYKPWGEIHYTWTSNPSTAPAYTLPTYTFTGQYFYLDDPTTSGVTEGFGLMFYRAASRRDNARWYDPALGRFAQADTVIPNNIQGLDRFAYVFNNPLAYVDPSGHCGVKEGKFDGKFDCTADDINAATMKQRLAWFKGFLAVTGRSEWFNNIIGILQAFIDEGLGDTNSWVSWVDAGILESIQNGWALFRKIKLASTPTAADMAWKDFFGTSGTDEDKLKETWGAAEKLGTQYGLSLAEQHGAEANWREKLFLFLGDKLYRDLLASGQMEKTYSTVGEMAGMISCGPLALTCATVGYIGGYKIGEWFGDPRSTVPFTDKAPVYFLTVAILEK